MVKFPSTNLPVALLVLLTTAVLGFIQTVIIVTQAGDRPPPLKNRLKAPKTPRFSWGASLVPFWIFFIAIGALLALHSVRRFMTAWRSGPTSIVFMRAAGRLTILWVEWFMAFLTVLVFGLKMEDRDRSITWTRVFAPQFVASIVSAVLAGVDIKRLWWLIAASALRLLQVAFLVPRIDRKNKWSMFGALVWVWVLLAAAAVGLGVALLRILKSRPKPGQPALSFSRAVATIGLAAYGLLSWFFVFLFFLLLCGFLDRSFKVAPNGGAAVPLFLWELLTIAVLALCTAEDLISGSRDSAWKQVVKIWHSTLAMVPGCGPTPAEAAAAAAAAAGPGTPAAAAAMARAGSGSESDDVASIDTDTLGELKLSPRSDSELRKLCGRRADIHNELLPNTAEGSPEYAALAAELKTINRRLRELNQMQSGYRHVAESVSPMSPQKPTKAKGAAESPSRAATQPTVSVGGKRLLPPLESEPFFIELLASKHSLQQQLLDFRRKYQESTGHDIRDAEDRRQIEDSYQAYKVQREAIALLRREYAAAVEGEPNKYVELRALYVMVSVDDVTFDNAAGPYDYEYEYDV